MAQVQQRILRRACAVLGAAAIFSTAGEARRFYDDDPLQRMPKPLRVEKPNNRKLSEIYDYFYNTFAQPGEHHTPSANIPAQAANTLGEVPDSNWYTNRHGARRMSLDELVRGAGNRTPPATDGAWRVVAAKSEGVTPGLTIEDSAKRRYLLKFDSARSEEIATAADVIGAKFFWALGYFTPENYIVYFNPEQLEVDPKARLIDYRGIERPMRQSDVRGILGRLKPDSRGRYRAVASLFLKGKPAGPFRYYGVRTDDPNDITPHEHRRDLRGLYVFSSWLNHTDTKSINSLDMLVEDAGVSHLRHHLLDFGAILGSDSFAAKSPRNGNVYMFDWKSSAAAMFTLGLYVPAWARADHPHVRGVGRIEADMFDPAEWKGNYYNAAFVNCLPDDAYWAAKKVMAFTDDEIAAIVRTGEHSDKEAEAFLISTLIHRRDKIGRTWFSKVLPLDNFRVEGNRLVFENLAKRYGFAEAIGYTSRWARFDNETEVKTALANASNAAPEGVQSRSRSLAPASDGQYSIPLHSDALSAPNGAYHAVDLSGGDPKKSVTVFLRKRAGALEVVGVERKW